MKALGEDHASVGRTYSNMAVMLDDGKPSQRLAAYHGAKAKGGRLGQDGAKQGQDGNNIEQDRAYLALL